MGTRAKPAICACDACESAHPFRRGDYATTKAWNIADCERVRIVRAEYLSLPVLVDGEWAPDGKRERWLHVEFRDGGRLLAHPSNLVPVVD